MLNKFKPSTRTQANLWLATGILCVPALGLQFFTMQQNFLLGLWVGLVVASLLIRSVGRFIILDLEAKHEVRMNRRKAEIAAALASLKAQS